MALEAPTYNDSQDAPRININAKMEDSFNMDMTYDEGFSNILPARYAAKTKLNK